MTSNTLLADRYKIVNSLGEGGMADVYLAIDTILNREVAIKVLRGELSNDPVTLLRFQREANAASKLNHPNVVQVYDVGTFEGRHYIVMEYIRGRTLKQLIQRRGALHKEEAINIMKQLVSAVEHAHKNNIIHRDIKPQNILVKDDGTVKITDFGIALAHNAVQLTQNDSVLGSAHYLAPETTRGEVATNQCDIYALGIVFYELLSGSVPFVGDNPVQIAMKHLSEDMPSIREFNPSLPQSIENIIYKATVKNKAYRYQTATEMLEDIEHCLDDDHQNDEIIEFIPEASSDSTTVVIDHLGKNQSKMTMLEADEEPKMEKSKKVWIGIGIVSLVLAILMGILIGTGAMDMILGPKTIVVPDVKNESVEDATQILEELGFTVTIEREELNDNIEEGHVIKTNPIADSALPIHSEIKLIVSRGGYFVVGDYKGQMVEAVESLLSDKNFDVRIRYQPSKLPKGTILDQELALPGDRKDLDSPNNRIRLIVAAPIEFSMIEVLDLPIEEAKKKLEDLGAVVELNQLSKEGLSEEELAELKTGVVVNCSVESGKLYIQDEGQKIVLDYYE